MNREWDLSAIVRRGLNRETTASPLLVPTANPNLASSSNLQNRSTHYYPNPCFGNHVNSSFQGFNPTFMPHGGAAGFNSQDSYISNQVLPNSSMLETPYLQEKMPVYKRKNRERTTQEYESVTVLDGWAWKKYGQRFVKGSIYPRDYYKCNSGYVCPAKKHVDTITANPVKYVITYYDWHNHLNARKPRI